MCCGAETLLSLQCLRCQQLHQRLKALTKCSHSTPKVFAMKDANEAGESAEEEDEMAETVVRTVNEQVQV